MPHLLAEGARFRERLASVGALVGRGSHWRRAILVRQLGLFVIGEVRTEGDEETGLCQMERALLFRAFGFDGVSSRELVGFFSSRVMCLNCHWLIVLAALCTMGWRSERKDRK